MHFPTYVMRRCCAFCHALPHIRHATLLCFLMHFHTHVMGWGGIITSLHLRSHALPQTGCYAAVFSHALPHIRHGVGGIITSLHLRSHALPQTRHATLLCFLMHFHTNGSITRKATLQRQCVDTSVANPKCWPTLVPSMRVGNPAK